MLFFAGRGFPVSALRRQGMGPVVMKDEIEYMGKCHLHYKVEMPLSLAGLAEDGRRLRIRNEFFRRSNKLAARVTSSSGWLDLNSRRLVCPQICMGCRKAPR